MKNILDELNKRKKIKRLLDDIESEVDNVKTMEDIKALFKKLITELRKLL